MGGGGGRRQGRRRRGCLGTTIGRSKTKGESGGHQDGYGRISGSRRPGNSGGRSGGRGSSGASRPSGAGVTAGSMGGGGGRCDQFHNGDGRGRCGTTVTPTAGQQDAEGQESDEIF